MRFGLLVIRTVTPKAHREYVLGDTLERFAELAKASGEKAAARTRNAAPPAAPCSTCVRPSAPSNASLP